MSRHMHTPSWTRDIERYSKEEFQELYGVEICDDGTVFDPVTNKTFPTLADWAIAESEYENMDVGEEYGHGKQVYDDYY